MGHPAGRQGRQPDLHDLLERPFTRRQALAAAIAGASLLAGCGSKGPGEAGWTFVDDRRHTVTLPKRPTRIAAFQVSAAALLDWGVTPVAVFGEDPPRDIWLAGFPWTKAELVGSVYGEIDVAKLLALKTELIVSEWYPPPRDRPLFGFKDLAQQESIAARVPTVGLRANTIATAQIAQYAALARALGVDTRHGRVAQARETFEQAAEHLSGVAQRKSTLRIIGVSAEQSMMYVSKLADAGDLLFYRHRGMPIVSARTSDAYWDRLSWDNAGKYAADAILYDIRPGVLPLADAKKIPGFAALPAVQADQIGPWRADPPASYQAYAKTMNELAATIATWRRLT